jgi:hypothetical protein
MIFAIPSMIILMMACWVLLTGGTVPVMIWVIISLLILLAILTA